MEALKHIRAILLLPFMVIIAIPVLILSRSAGFEPAWPLCVPCLLGPLLVSAFLAGTGLLIIIKTIYWFATVGKGTLAPWDPTRKLVVSGVYRHVRNPMISGVLCILLAEALLFNSGALFYWFLFFLLLNLVYIPLLEERSLERRFGEDYRLYKQNVPRWIPRLTPWELPNAEK